MRKISGTVVSTADGFIPLVPALTEHDLPSLKLPVGLEPTLLAYETSVPPGTLRERKPSARFELAGRRLQGATAPRKGVGVAAFQQNDTAEPTLGLEPRVSSLPRKCLTNLATTAEVPPPGIEPGSHGLRDRTLAF